MVNASTIENLFLFCVLVFSLVNLCVALMSIKEDDMQINNPQLDNCKVDLFVFGITFLSAFLKFGWVVILFVMAILYISKGVWFSNQGRAFLKANYVSSGSEKMYYTLMIMFTILLIIVSFLS